MRHRPRGVIIWVQMFATTNTNPHRRRPPKMQNTNFAKQNPAHGAGRSSASIRAAGLFRTGQAQTQNTLFAKQNPVNGAGRSSASIRAGGLFRTGQAQTQNTLFAKQNLATVPAGTPPRPAPPAPSAQNGPKLKTLFLQNKPTLDRTGRIATYVRDAGRLSPCPRSRTTATLRPVDRSVNSESRYSQQ